MSRRNRQENSLNALTADQEAFETLTSSTADQEAQSTDLDLREDTEITADRESSVAVLDEEIDMGEVEPESPEYANGVLSDLAKEILAAGKQSISQAKKRAPGAPKVSGVLKTPIFGKRPKGAWPYGNITVVDRSIQFTPHHQKTLILELIEFLGEGATMQKIVEHIESQESLWSRLKSNQSVFDCVKFHTKQLWDLGVLGAPGTKGKDPEDMKDE